MSIIEIPSTSYCYEESEDQNFQVLSERVKNMRSEGQLSPDVLHRIRKFFRLKNIYHSNAIEGNLLNVGETRQVVELGLTITGKPLKDQAEARNLSEALDFLEELAKDSNEPITESDIRQLHLLVSKGIDDDGAGSYRTVPVEISGSAFPPPGPESIGAEMQEFAIWLNGASTPSDETFASVDGLIAAAVAPHVARKNSSVYRRKWPSVTFDHEPDPYETRIPYRGSFKRRPSSLLRDLRRIAIIGFDSVHYSLSRMYRRESRRIRTCCRGTKRAE